MEKRERIEKIENNDVGSIRIADEVVGIIAGMAATEISGVAGMSAGLVGGIAEMLGKKNLAKGVKVEVGEREAAVDLYIIVEYITKYTHSLLKRTNLQKIRNINPNRKFS